MKRRDCRLSPGTPILSDWEGEEEPAKETEGQSLSYRTTRTGECF